MKILSIAFLLLLMMAGPTPVSVASDDVSVIIANMPVSYVLDVYEKFSGKKVAASTEVKAMKVYVSAKIRKKSKEEALRILEGTLLNQAGVEIVHEPDGGISARKLVPEK